MRIIVFCGNGGAGVSTVAAATALSLARGGKRTLAFGITSGLGAALDAELGLDAVSVTDGLDAVEGHGGHGGPDEFRDWLRALLDWRGMEPELADDLAALPGVNHIGRLLELQRLLRAGDYGAAVLDAAEVSEFLDLPGALEAGAHWLDRLFAPRQQTVFEPFLRAFAGDYATAGEDVFETGRDLLTRLADLKDVLADPAVSSVRLVIHPSERGVAAVREAVGVLGLFRYRMDAVIVNRLLPDEITEAFFDAEKVRQAQAMSEIGELHLNSDIVKVALAPGTFKGIEALEELAERMYPDGVDGTASEVEADGVIVEREPSQYVVSIRIPFAKREQLRLEEVDGGIAVRLNGRRCVISLADLRYTEASSWTYEESKLRVVLDR